MSRNSVVFVSQLAELGKDLYFCTEESEVVTCNRWVIVSCFLLSVIAACFLLSEALLRSGCVERPEVNVRVCVLERFRLDVQYV